MDNINMTNKDQMTVNSLKKLLDELSTNGCGDMNIFLGNTTPLLKHSISIDYFNKQLLIRNTYYDKTMIDASNEFKDAINSAIQNYICNCYKAGRDIMKE